MKTNRSMRRRFRFSATGRIMRAKANRRHLLSHRATKRKRQLRRPDLVHETQAETIGRLLPYQ